MFEWVAVILAAGKGIRMKSRMPKVLHPICGREMICYPVERAAEVTSKTILVVGSHGEEIRSLLGDSVDFAVQKQPLGTAHALRCAQPMADGKGENILVLNGDVPLISATTLKEMMMRHLARRAVVTILTAMVDNPEGLGRVVRDERGKVMAVVEEAEADEELIKAREVNAGVYCFRGQWLWPRLKTVPRRGNGEHYLTDMVFLAREEGEEIEAVSSTQAGETIGINTRQQLARAEEILRDRIRQRAMSQGVTLLDPRSVYIDEGVSIGRDTVVYPNTYLLGRTAIGEECRIGPNSIIENSSVGKGCHIQASVLEGAAVAEGVTIGPFSHIRFQSHIGRGVHIGNFAEVKNSRLGAGTKVGHFSYVGDAELGSEVNIGAGTVTCNFDGVGKHRTVIDDGAFIGSDTMLIAPVHVGRGAITGAGSVVNHDVPPETLAVGVPARLRKKGKVKVPPAPSL
ncbi:MAG: bifunctional UDP-N-acetylglucosamine diphosphorylase/glucosamine-1-phosphate N-acetyltransferase GlmU [Chloroflexi bacterium]|nr:bifunctional UDP-N-acetylglucosamine diphosphorylase/glucosamine-1-phosphate N-acetyltransferase GlmU [Chloroflexota bacterium]